MANNSTFDSICHCHGSVRYSVRPGPVRKTLNSSCSSLPPYARWQKEYRVANIDVGNAEIKLATSSVHPVSAEHCPRQPV